jgi:hypothetical protein
LWEGIFSTKKEKGPKRKKRGGLMETDVDVEIQKTGFPHRLAKRLLAFRTVPTRPAAITTTQEWAKSDDQCGPNQVDKTNSVRLDRALVIIDNSR